MKFINTYYSNRQLWYVPLVGVAMVLMMSRPLFIAHLMSNEKFAYYSAGLLVSSTFSMLGCFGLQPLLQREMPMQLVRGRERAALLLLSQCILISFSCLIVGWALTALGLRVAGLTAGIAAASILHGFSQQAFLLSTIESRSRGNPLKFARETLLRAVLVLAGTITSAMLFHSPGKTLLTEAIISIGLAHRLFRGTFATLPISQYDLFRLALSRLRKIPWGKAGSLLSVVMVGFLLINLDRWLAASLLSASLFSLYAFAWIVIMIAQSTQFIISASVYPLLARRFAGDGRIQSFKIASKASLAILLIGVVLYWPAVETVKFAIPHWFPKYGDSVGIMEALMAVAILRVSDFWTSHLIVIGRDRCLLFIQSAVALAVISGWVAVARPWDGHLSPEQIVLLAVCTTVSNYAVVLSLSVLSRK